MAASNGLITSRKLRNANDGTGVFQNGKINPISIHTPPTGFDVPPPLSGIYAYRNGASWGCNITPETLIDTSGITNTYYVDASAANDAGSGKSWNYRKRTIAAAMVAAEADGVPTRILLYAPGGPFYRQISICGDGNARTNTHTILIESMNGRAIIGNFDNLTWTLVGGYNKTYSSTRSNAIRAINTEIETRDKLPTEYAWVTSIAAVEAAPGSWYTDGTTTYIHPHGSVAPTLSNAKILLAAARGAEWQSNANLMIRGCDLYGGSSGALKISGGSTNIVVLDDCRVGYGGASNVFASGTTVMDSVVVLDVGLFAAFNSMAFCGAKDGFNFHANNSVVPNALLVNCYGIRNGLSPSQSNNGFTCHDGVHGISIGGTWMWNYGNGSGHVGDGTQVWSVGDVAGGSPGDIPTGGSINRGGFGAWSGATKLWLDSCRDICTEIGLYSNDNAALYLRNHRGSGQRAGTGVYDTF